MISKWPRDVDFEDFTETEQSRFCIQRINKIGDCKPSKQCIVYVLWSGGRPTRITVGPPTGMNEKHCIRAMIGRTPTLITVGPPTGMNEKQCMVMYTCYDQGNQTTKLTWFPSGRAMLTSRISQRQNSPGSAFKGSIRLEIASHRKLQSNQPLATLRQSIKPSSSPSP
jgi:hypothetical protein